MEEFNEVELYNDGTITLYDLYTIIRPDIDKLFDEIVHYDARFIIKEPNGRSERKIVSITHTPEAKPVTPVPLSPKDRMIEDYVRGKGPRPLWFTKDMLNSGGRINGLKVNSDTIAASAEKVGDIIFIIKDDLTGEDIRNLYEYIWKRGPADSRNDNDSNAKSPNKNWNFCLDLWCMNAFNGCKSSSRIRILDLDRFDPFDGLPVYRNWHRIYKDLRTQNVVIEME